MQKVTCDGFAPAQIVVSVSDGGERRNGKVGMLVVRAPVEIAFSALLEPVDMHASQRTKWGRGVAT